MRVACGDGGVTEEKSGPTSAGGGASVSVTNGSAGSFGIAYKSGHTYSDVRDPLSTGPLVPEETFEQEWG